MNYFYSNYTPGVGGGMMNGYGYGSWLIPLLVWSLFWKGLALWHSARKGQPWWFVIMLIVNTAGILEIIYLFAVIKLKFDGLFKK